MALLGKALWALRARFDDPLLSRGTVPFDSVHPGLERPDFKPKPLHVVGEGRYAFAPGRGACAKPVIVNSIPKAGTYMVALLLRRLGLIDTEIMLGRGWLWDHRGLTQDEIVFAPDDHIAGLYLKDSAPLVLPGQFATAHLQYDEAHAALLADFVVLFAVRDLRDALVSHMRYLADPRRRDSVLEPWLPIPDGPERFCAYLEGPGKGQVELFQEMAGWLDAPGVTLCRYETAMGDSGSEAQQALFSALARALGGGRGGAEVARVFRVDVLGQKTRTLSTARSAFTPYDTPAVAAALAALGVPALNRRYGYG